MDAQLSRKLSSPGKAMLFGKDLADLPVMRLLVRVQRSDSASLQDLEAEGVTIHAVAGDVLTCEARGDALGAVAALDQVISIEISRPLYPDA